MALKQGLQEGPRYFEAMQGLVCPNGSPITSCSGTVFNFQTGEGTTTGSAGWFNYHERFLVTPFIFLSPKTGSSHVYAETIGTGSFFVVGSTSQAFNWLAAGQRP